MTSEIFDMSDSIFGTFDIPNIDFFPNTAYRLVVILGLSTMHPLYPFVICIETRLHAEES